jgi:hypothetical protein
MTQTRQRFTGGVREPAKSEKSWRVLHIGAVSIVGVFSGPLRAVYTMVL